MRIFLPLIAVAALAVAPAAAQVTGADHACAQDRATVGTGGDLTLKDSAKDTGGKQQDLSDKLAKTGGVICPPSNVDTDIKAPTPEGGKIQVIPPPGTPQNQPNVQPK